MIDVDNKRVRPFSVDEILPEILPATYHMFYSVSEHDLHLFHKSIQSTHIYHENDIKSLTVYPTLFRNVIDCYFIN